MIPFIMAAISAAQQKAKSENQELQNQANALRQNQIQMPQQQIPSINNVFGNY